MSYVILHPEWGIYLGSAMGFAYWSKLDPADQPSAITFPTVEHAEMVMIGWDTGRPKGVCFHAVFADCGEHASMQSCMKSGLPGWA